MTRREVAGFDVVEDVTAERGPDEGFLRLKRLVLRTRYVGGDASAPFACDIVSRQHVDAVAIVIYDIVEGVVCVALRRGIRPPLTFRRAKAIPHATDDAPLMLEEIVAGVLETDDAGPGGIEARAAAECLEEAGYKITPASVEPLGAPLFASPGVSDERIHFRCVRTDLDERGEPCGDGSVMEEAGSVVLRTLDEALARCDDGRLPDMKTEVGLRRLRARLTADRA